MNESKLARCLVICCLCAFICGCNSKKHDQVFDQQDAASTETWPRQINKDGNRLTYYQPQIDAWTDYRKLSGRVAIVLTPAAGQSQTGMIMLEARTDTDQDERMVKIHDIQVTGALFPGLDDAAEIKAKALATDMFPKDTVLISLDRMLAAGEDQNAQGQRMALKTDAPKIFVSTAPAILLVVDGAPVRAPVPQTSLEVVANANWNLFFDKTGNKYYLSYPPLWLQASSLNGPWTIAKNLPADMSKLPDDWADVRKTVPPSVPADVQAPTVFSYNKAADLIVFDGKPEWKTISNTNLAYATNTDSDFFIDYSSNRFYYLTSGRWFSSLQQSGPWTFAGDKLPPDFADIPPDSPAADVLPSVPGTDEAREAVMMAQIPTLATVNKTAAAAAVKVNYQGEPQFQPITNTQLSYAVNTDSKVIKVGDLYYLCLQGVWFMSRGVNGPWETASSVPSAIYQIPPSSPVYNVTYVKVYESTPDTVTCGYTAGYMGTFVLGMAVGAAIAYGSGYYYPPHVYWGPHPVPYYVGYPRTYGVGYHYNYYNGGYYAQQSVYGPYGAASRAAWYNPSTGFYSRAASVQTIAGGRTAGQAYNPWTGTYAATRQGNNAYSQWGSSVAVRGDEWVQTAHRSNPNGTVAGGRTSEGGRVVGAVGRNGSGFVGQDKDNNVYAGRDGNIYKKDTGGSWQKYENGGWSSAPPSATLHTSPQNAKARSADQPRASTQPVSAQTRPATMQGRAPGTSQYPSAQTRPTTQPGSAPSQQPATGSIQQLDRDAAARQRGAQQTQQYQLNRQNSTSPSSTSAGQSRRVRSRRQ